MSRMRLCLLLALFWLWLPPGEGRAEVWDFELSCHSDLLGEGYTGRVYVFCSSRGEPRRGPGWFSPEPFLSVDVENWRGEPLTIAWNDPLVRRFPRNLQPTALSGLLAQGVVRLNPHDPEIGTGVGNGFGPVMTLPLQPGRVSLSIDRLVPETPVAESDWYHVLEVPSQLLSEFHGREVLLRGGVLLPASYFAQPERVYPVIYSIPGFGGDHRLGRIDAPVREDNPQGVEFLRVFLDPRCGTGHHVFADSATNGPVGEALVSEFIPALEQQYRAVAAPQARFVTGHSSGGWSSLWLQVTYPEVFGGTWSTSPDPVDFRDFQRINIYRPGENMFRDAEGRRRPLARQGNQVLIWYDDFSDMEDVLGPGGQLHSFEAVFSPLDEAGRPRLLWDRETGAIDPDVAHAWEAYDIRLQIERNWETIGPQLSGKIHVYMGDQDTFYLEGAVRLLAESLQALGSDAIVEMFPGHDHSSLLTPQLRARMRAEMVESYLRHAEQELLTPARD